MNKNEILSIANDYSSQYNSYPFDIYRLISDLNLMIVEKPLNTDGYFINMNKRQRIYINKNITNEGRKRFTLAHEVGHYVLHGEHPILKVKDPKNYFNFKGDLRSIEEEANFFASELLSPSNKTEEKLPNRTFKVSDIENISAFFNISFTSAAIKCVENSKTLNELLIFFDGNDEIKWFSSGNDEWVFDDMPKESGDIDFFCESSYKKNTISVERRDLNIYGVIYLVSGKLKEIHEI